MDTPHFIRRNIREMGAARISVLLGGISVVGSATICYAAYWLFGVAFSPISIALPLVVPLLLAPAVVYVLSRLIQDMDAMAYRLALREEALSREIAERRRTERALRASESELRGILDNMLDVYFRTDREGRFVMVSKSIRQMSGFRPDEMVGAKASTFFEDQEPDYERFMAALKQSGGRVIGYESRSVGKDGRAFWMSLNARYVYDDEGGIIGVEGTARDISQLVDTDRKLAQMANHDPLTGVANRRLFIEQLQASLLHSHRWERGMAVLCVDLDGFAAVNDRFGSRFGDWMLLEVTDRLRNTVRGRDLLARIGGDAFAVLLGNIRGADDAMAVAGKAADSLRRPFERDGRRAEITATLAVVQLTGDEVSADEVMADVEETLRLAQKAGAGAIRLHDRSNDGSGGDLPSVAAG